MLKDLDQALAEISAIRSQIARSVVFRGYGPATVATTGLLALVAAGVQAALLRDPTGNLPGYLALWAGAAVLCAGLVGVEMVTRARRVHSGLAQEMLATAVEQFDLSWTSGVKGTWWAMCAARPHMAARGWGRIINMVSLAAERGDAGLGEYNAAKAGIAALTRTAAREWGRQGITANAIAPGAWTKRGQDYAARDPEGFAKAMAARPIARLGDPETDIAPVALFLASEDARFLTGQVLYVDGGAHLG